MRKVIAAAALAASLAGCASVKEGVLGARDFLNDPKTQAAVATAERGASIAICDVSGIAGLTADLIAAVSVDKNGQPVNKGAQKRIDKSAFVATASDRVCGAIGGKLAGSATATAATPVVTVPAS